jgi:para-nitrobenzyl esterase
MTGGHQSRYALQDRMSAAWTNFARTGNPNVKGLLPDWPAFDTAKRATMVLDDECHVANDPNGEERRTLNAVRDASRRPTSSTGG